MSRLCPVPLSLYAGEIIRLATCRHCGKQEGENLSSQNLMSRMLITERGAEQHADQVHRR